jgi:hypothetical protein
LLAICGATGPAGEQICSQFAVRRAQLGEQICSQFAVRRAQLGSNLRSAQALRDRVECMLGTTQPTHATASLHQASFRLRKTLIWTGYDRKPYGKHQFLEVPRMSRFRGDKKKCVSCG